MMTMTTKRKNSPVKSAAWLVAVVCCTSCFCGCGQSESTKHDAALLSELRQLLISQSKLPDEQMVSDAREQLAAEGVSEVDVVLKGRINAGADLSPWEDGTASFVLTDAIGHEGEDDHDPHTCPYCSPNINDYLVMVSFLDDDGRLIKIDSRELFDVKEKQMVLVEGKARIDPDDKMLYLDAVKLHRVGE